MKSKSIFTAITLFAGSTLTNTMSAKEKENQKPNVIFILADDMGYECLGAYNGTYQTPNLDNMAQVGVKFNYAYAQPLSTPSRVEAMTGKYNHKNYVDFGFMDQRQKTFGNLAQMAGYKTCIAGKWQLGENSKLPAHFGFDNYCLWQLNYKRSAEGERYANALLEEDGNVIERDRDMYGPDKQADFIDKFIDNNKSKPFFIYYPMVLVHNPFVPTPQSSVWNLNPNLRSEDDPKYFPDMMIYCDKMVGRLIEKLKKEGLYENTLIIFTGDNGTNKQITSTLKDGTVIHGGKGMSTDAGTHVGLFTTFGSKQTKHFECDDLVDFTDIMPTLADAMEIKVPKEWDTDGVSFFPQIIGKKGTPRKWVFCHYDSFFAGVDKPSKEARRYIRDHQYKLYSTGAFFDVKNDVLEQHNIPKGKGTKEAEASRSFLSKEISKFPAWKLGDKGNPKVTLPGLEVKPIKWRKSED